MKGCLYFSLSPCDKVKESSTSVTSPSLPSLPLQNEALQLCIRISLAIDQVEFMFTSEFQSEVDESECSTLQQYYREAMIQGYNFAFEVRRGEKG